jgi:serine/threonine protein kinase
MAWGRCGQLPDGISGDGAAFLRGCFTVDPKARPPARALVHHDWLAHLSRSLPASAFDSDPVGPLGPGPPLAAEAAAAAAEDEAADGDVSAAAEREAEVHGRGSGLRSSVSTPCLQQAGNEAGWLSD